MKPWEIDWQAQAAAAGQPPADPAAAPEPAPWERDWKASAPATSPAAPAQKKQSWGDFAGSLARSVVQGATLNFGDEIEAFVRSRVGSGDYEKELARIRDEMDEFKKSNPWSSTLAELAGGIVLPGMGAGKAVAAGVKGATSLTAGAVGRSAAAGAGYGAVAGYGAGEGVENRLEGAAAGGVVGGALGGALPVVGEGVKHTGQAVGTALRRLGVRGDDANVAAGERTLLDSAREAAKNQKVTLDDELTRWEKAADGRAPLYGASEEVAKLADDATKLGGAGAEAARKFVEDGVEARARSNSLGIEDLAGGQGYRASKGDVIDDLYNKVKPEYDALYKGGREAIPTLDTLIKDDRNGLKPIVTEALKEATDHAWKIDGVTEKLKLTGNGAEWTPRQVDYILRKLRDKVEDSNGGDKLAAMRMKDKVEAAIKGTTLGDEVLRVRGEFADNRMIDRALKFGRGFEITKSGRIFEDNLIKFKGYSQSEKEAAKIGIRDKLMDYVNGKDGVENALAQLNNKTTKANLREIFGQEADDVVAQIERAVQNKGVEDRIGGAVKAAQGGRQSIETPTMAGYSSDMMITMGLGAPIPPYAIWRGVKGLSQLDRQSSEAVVRALTDLQARGTNVPGLFERLRKMDERQQQDFIKRLVRAGRFAQQGGAATGEFVAQE